MSKDIQIFTAFSPKRWQAVRTVFGVFVASLVAGFVVFLISVIYPNRPIFPKSFQKLDIDEAALFKDTTLIHFKNPKVNGFGSRLTKANLPPLSPREPIPREKQIRAAFIEDGKTESMSSLRDNAAKLNMVMPDWLHQAKDSARSRLADTVTMSVDHPSTLELLMNQQKIAVLPQLQLSEGSAESDSLIALMNNPVRSAIFIESVSDFLKKRGFQGICMNYQTNEAQWVIVKKFHEALYKKLNANGLQVTQTLYPRQTDIKWVGEFNDLVFFMPMNESYEMAGPIAGQKWVEAMMTQVATVIPTEKLILATATYGYDWGNKAGHAQTVGFQHAISIAAEAGAKIAFDNDTYNLNFNYLDDKHEPHRIFFTDAATNFNAIRAAQNMAWRGAALTHLGYEDNRVWNFYDKDLTVNGLNSIGFDFNKNSPALKNDRVHFIGNGEVLDVISEPTDGKVIAAYDSTQHLVLEENYEILPSAYVIRRNGAAGQQKVVLSFDDGPDPKYTPQILDILKKDSVPATFFMMGKLVKENEAIVKRVFDEGHEIGNHTFTHPHLDKVTAFKANLELDYTRRAIESITGHSTILFRAPYTYNNSPDSLNELMPFLLARKHHYLSIGESIDPRDWQPNVTTEQILERLEAQKNHGNIVLLHDAGGKRESTVKALPAIIAFYKKQGFKFVTTAELLGKKREDVMPSVLGNQKVIGQTDKYMSGVIFSVNKWLSGLFYWAIWLSMVRIVFVATLACIQKYRERHYKSMLYTPPVSIIVPAYNEEMGAIDSVKSLLNQDYPEYEIMFVDDGSKDTTYAKVKAAFEHDERVSVNTKPNGGKASALNYGIARAKHDFVVCIDADTQLDPQALREIVKPFFESKVAAVAGNVYVGNQINVLTKWQAIEYTTAQNFDRLAFNVLNCITVVPGAIGAFRKEVILEVGGFTTDTLAEDCDLTMRIIKKGYLVGQNNASIAITEAPESFEQFRKQRFRWCFGVMQAFWKNRDALFKPRYGGLGWVALPNILIFQMFLPLFAPIADLLLIAALCVGASSQIFWFYIGFMMIDLACAILAYTFDGEIDWSTLKKKATWLNWREWKLWLVLLMFPQRIVYRPIMYIILFKSYIKAFKGELMGWGVLQRTGTAKLQTS
jgi:cellulose synthase/poly-beta-1,6-N-acetylglucosamine synthase-like glycosyltransferase/peptidoglycan/xylan/chitin deacetylase (PgdA/CDA1 family)/spore germination protein YaaH